MTMPTPAPSGSSPPWGAAMEYFAPPLVIPVAVMLAVLLFALVHGPVI